MTVNELKQFVENGPRGLKCEYYRGFLPLSKGNATAHYAYKLFLENKVFLIQQKHEDMDYSYYVVVRSKGVINFNKILQTFEDKLEFRAG
ncbi:MAG: hypothetical protein ACREBU_02120 [Nitrososphaera sp.]